MFYNLDINSREFSVLQNLKSSLELTLSEILVLEKLLDSQIAFLGNLNLPVPVELKAALEKIKIIENDLISRSQAFEKRLV